MTYFADVIHRPAYCAAHVVPLQALPADLARAATTPNFAWVSPNDCTDMEGCGIRCGDQFLARELGEIMRSPAWRTQRSLAIITFDEDGYDHQHPAQRVPTLVLGTPGVRQGYVSRVRSTHYSLLRTIEGALGLGTLTSNDLGPARPATCSRMVVAGGIRQARERSDDPRHAPGLSAPGLSEPGLSAPGLASGPALAVARRRPGPAGATRAGARSQHPTAFVVNSDSGTVTPVNLAKRRAGRPIRSGSTPLAIAITPGGQTAYVVNRGSGTVTPIATATRRAGTPIAVGRDPQTIAITPDGRTAYVANTGSGTVTPINLAKRRPGRAIRVGTTRRRSRSPGRPDGLRPRLGQLGSDADRHGHRPGRAAAPGRQLPHTRSRSHRTAPPPTSPATARTASPRSPSPPGSPAVPSRSGRRQTPSP